jgi:hypothetical protein
MQSVGYIAGSASVEPLAAASGICRQAAADPSVAVTEMSPVPETPRFETTGSSYADQQRPERRRCSVMRTNVAIAIAEEARDRIYEVAQVCRALGFAHTSTLSVIGVLIGSAEVEDLPMLRAIPGVLGVEMDRSLRTAANPGHRPAAADLQRSWSSNGNASGASAVWLAASTRSK